MEHKTEGRPFDDLSPCTGNSHCDLCATCGRRTSRKKDEHFLLTAPGNGKKCLGYQNRR